MTDTGAKFIAAAILGASLVFYMFGAFIHKYAIVTVPGERVVFRLDQDSGEIVLCGPSGSSGAHAIFYACD